MWKCAQNFGRRGVGSKNKLKKKTSLFFSKSTKEDVKDEIKNVLGVNEIRSCERYLGCPH